MLIIRRAQMEALCNALNDDFRRRLNLALARLTPASPDFDLEEFIDAGVAVAQRFDLTSEAEVYRFLSIAYTRLPSCDTSRLSRAAMTCLTAYGVPASERLQNFEELLAGLGPAHD